MKSPELILSIVQTSLHWEAPGLNREHFEKLILGHREKMEVVILPEMFTTGFTVRPEPVAETMEGPTVAWMKRIAAAKKIILCGSVIISEGGAYYNRLLWVLPNGSTGVYDKRHLFAAAGEHEHFSAGNKRLISAVKGWRLNLQICYDLRFPIWARQSKPLTIPGKTDVVETQEAEYDVLVYTANWPKPRIQAWRTLLQARAIENQCYVVGVNRIGEDGNGKAYTGDSLIVSPLGEILMDCKSDDGIFSFTLSAATVEETRSRLPFLKDADHFLLGNQL